MHRVLFRFAFLSTVMFTTAGLASAADSGLTTLFKQDAAAHQTHCAAAYADQQPWLTFSTDALILHLNRGTQEPVGVVFAEVEAENRLTTHDLDFNMEAGPRFALGAQLDSQRSVEAVYFGLHHWHTTRQAFDDNNLSLPGDLPFATQDFFMADRMTLDYTSKIHNAEVNYWRRLGCGPLHFLAGFRYFSLGESFNINSQNIDSGTSDYHIRTRNHLYGAQLGSRWESTFRWFDLDVVGKAGVYGNAAGQSTFMGDLDNTIVLRDFNTSGSHAAFIGELGFNGTVYLTNHLSARVGYNLIWVEGVARAADQLDFTDTQESGSHLAFDKGAFLHGVNVGLEAQW